LGNAVFKRGKGETQGGKPGSVKAEFKTKRAKSHLRGEARLRQEESRFTILRNDTVPGKPESLNRKRNGTAGPSNGHQREQNDSLGAQEKPDYKMFEKTGRYIQ